jgi:hypothetical protein
MSIVFSEERMRGRENDDELLTNEIMASLRTAVEAEREACRKAVAAINWNGPEGIDALMHAEAAIRRRYDK